MRRRGAYRRHAGGELGAIEARRVLMEVSIDELAARAEIDVRTLYRMRRTGLAFPRQVLALKRALTSLERERRRADTMMPEAGDAD